MVVAFLWLFLMRYMARYLVWISLLGILGCNFWLTYYCYTRIQALQGENSTIPLGPISNRTLGASLSFTGRQMSEESETLQRMLSATFMPAIQSNTDVEPHRLAKHLRLAGGLGGLGSDGGNDGFSGRTYSAVNNNVQFEFDFGGLLKDSFDPYLQRQSTWIALMSISGVVLVILLLLFCCIVTRIKLAIAIIEEAARAVNMMKSTVFFPVFPYLFKLAALGAFVVAFIIISSASHLQYRTVDGKNCVPYHLDVRKSRVRVLDF